MNSLNALRNQSLKQEYEIKWVFLFFCPGNVPVFKQTNVYTI